MGNLITLHRWLILTLLLVCLFLSPKTLAITYSNTDTSEIPDNDPDGIISTLEVTESQTIADMNVSVFVTHDWIADVALKLTHEDTGTSIILVNQMGVNEASNNVLGCGLNDLRVLFDDEISESLVSVCQNSPSFAYGIDGTQKYTIDDFANQALFLEACVAIEYQCNPDGEYAAQGSFLPNDGSDSGLHSFYGEDSLGTWTLTASDSVTSDTGTLENWGITFADTNCGNGTIEGSEECDDNNFLANDGCSAFCEIEEDADGDGYYTDTDCNDNNSEIHPDAIEICDDGIDNDCDGNMLRPTVWYLDNDADGYGLTSESVSSCETIDLFVTTPGDCNDDNSEIYPSQIEIEDGFDNDCDNYVDEDTDSFDDDEDGYTENAGDCDDSNDLISPDATEICDGIDNNCDDTIDEDCEDPATPPTDDSTEENTDDSSTNDSDSSDATDSDDTDNDSYTTTHTRNPTNNATPTSTNNEDSEGNNLRDWASNPLRSSVVAAGCSLNSAQGIHKNPTWLFAVLSIILLTRLRPHKKSS